MRKTIFIFSVYIFLARPIYCPAQDSLSLRGQLSAWLLYNNSKINNLPVYADGRYIPQLNYSFKFKNDHKIDFEASANLNGNAAFNFSGSDTSSGQLKPYRLWSRYSSRQFEFRLGLQKINFGSASILRPLMWFDQVDPRDPLKFTDGVWGALGRFYFLNNANIWLWCLYGNNKPKGWEITSTNTDYPEVGGRIQLPVPSGEAALSYHHRVENTETLPGIITPLVGVREDRIGFDFKLDAVAGIWFEGSWTTRNKDLGMYTNQEILNVGLDYTFGLGNGLYVVWEQLLAANDEEAFKFSHNSSFSLASVSYPVGLSDNISGIVYYDWKNKNIYNFVNWQKQFKNLTLYLIGYWNPEDYRIPAQGSGQNLFAGKGIQVMLVLNH